jgi:hypothetical protein
MQRRIDGRYKNYALKRFGEDGVLSLIEVISKYLPGETEKNNENFIVDS